MKIKFLSIFIIVATIAVFSQITFAATGDVSLVLSTSSLAPNQAFDVEVHVDTGGRNLSAFNIYLDFESTDVTVVVSQGSDGLSSGNDTGDYTMLGNPDDIANGHYRFGGVCAQNCANGSDIHIATIHMQTQLAFNSGTSNLSLRVNELADELGATIDTGTLMGAQITSNVVDAIAPVISNAQPSGTLDAGTTETTISLSTDENATCRYSASAGIDYDTMTDYFTTTGGASHSAIVTGLSDGGSYHYYVRCVDGNSNKNSTDLEITFSINTATTGGGGGGGSTGGGGGASDSAVVISNGTPFGTLSSDITEAVVAINTNKNATCKYSASANTLYSSMTAIFNSTGGLSHSFNVTGLEPGNTYNYYIRCQNKNSTTSNTKDYKISFTVKNNESSNDNSSLPTSETEPDSSMDLGNQGSDLPLTTLTIKEKDMYQKLKGKILLKVEDKGRAYYIHPVTEVGYYLGRPRDAFRVMREQGVGITNADLKKIPFGLDRLVGNDIDGDGLPDLFEEAIGTNKNKKDSDSDGYLDKEELEAGYSPIGAGKLPTDSNFVNKHLGKIFLQVEGNGEAWYIYNGKRYYLGRPDGAFAIMRYLSLGISNSDFDKFSSEK